MINDDAVLDAQDMAAEIAVARGESCAVHEGAKLPCPFDHDDANEWPECGKCGHASERDSDGRCLFKYIDAGPYCSTYCGCVCEPPADDAVLDDVDAVLTSLQKETPVSTTEDTFERVLNQWLDACIKETKEAPNVAATLAIFRLGTLGQRLLYEANHVGMREVMTVTKDVLNPVHDKEPPL